MELSDCGTKQTMPDANVFYKLGKCEECQRVTDIEADGCNFCAVMSRPGVEPIADLIAKLRPPKS